MGMGREERAQRFGKEFGQRVGVGEDLDLPAAAAGVGREILAQPFGLAQDGARMLQQ